MWQVATQILPLVGIAAFRLVLFSTALACLFALFPQCYSFRLYGSHSNINWHKDSVSVHNKLYNSYGSSIPLSAEPDVAFCVKGKDVKSQFLSALIQRGLVHSATDVKRLDEFLCSQESSEKAVDGLVPAVYYGIDLTANFIHEGTLLHLLLLRRFMARGFNVVVVLGGGTTLVGDPSFKTERTKATLSSSEHDNLVPNAILNRAVTNAYVKQDNYAGILGIVKKILTRQLDTEKNGTVSPSWFQASELDAHNISNITSTPNNIIVVNNRDLYDRVTLSEYLDTVARHMSVGRMLSRDSIRNRLHMSDEDGITTLHKANMDLAEFVYMSLQAMDFVHVASKFNAVIQLGGSDQMGNIISGIELASGLGDMCKPLFGITTPLLQTRTGEKVSKSNAEKLLRITVDTAALAFWSHFRNVDDEVVQNYLQLLTQVPLHEIETTMGKHINEAKVLLADELTSSIFTADFTNALRKHWVNGNIGDLIKSQGALTHSDYDTFLSFTKCVPRVELSRDQLESGIPFADLMDRLRTPQLATGVFYSNRRAIREGTCRINGQVVTEVDRLVTNDDLLTVSCEDGRYLQYIALQFGKRQLYFAIMA